MKKYLGVALVALGVLSVNTAEAEERIVKVVSDYDNMKMYFEPRVLRINVGDTVTWVNEVTEDHNMITYPDGVPHDGKPFSSPYLTQAGETWSHTFDVEGTYEYHCIPHIFMGMRGTVIAGKETPKEEMHIPTKEEMAVYRETLLEFFDEEDLDIMPAYVRAKKSAQKKNKE